MDRYAKFRRKLLKKGVHASVCSLCNQGRFTELTLRVHLQKEHNYKSCKSCRDIFDNDTALKEHVCPLQNITCELCSKSFRSASGWILHHRKVHGGMRPVCDICGDQLGDVNALRRHLMTRHLSLVAEGGGQVVPPCHICGKQLKNRASLYDHERRVHKGNCRSEPCIYCKRIFYTSWSLKRHLATVHRDEVGKAIVKGRGDEGPG